MMDGHVRLDRDADGVGFFETLLQPDREEEEMAERSVVIQAANLLQVGEFQLLQLAYRDWYGEALPEAMVSDLFTAYMLRNEVPSWARHYARKIIALDDRHALDDSDPAYHAFDAEYRTRVPHGVRQFLIASAILAFLMVTAVLVAGIAAENPTSLLPPYFDRNDLPGGRGAGGIPPIPDIRRVP